MRGESLKRCQIPAGGGGAPDGLSNALKQTVAQWVSEGNPERKQNHRSSSLDPGNARPAIKGFPVHCQDPAHMHTDRFWAIPRPFISSHAV